MENKEKIVAAMSAVMAYIRQEEEAVAKAAEASPYSMPSDSVKLWNLSSRQDIMNMRSLMQLKAFNIIK